MDLSRKITLNTLAQIVGRSGVVFVSFITTAILTRSLGQAGYGVFGLINVAVAVFFSFADWGTNLIAVREFTKSPEKASLIFGNCLILRTFMAFLGVIFFCLFVFLNPSFRTFQKEALAASLIILFFSLKTSAQIVFHSKLKLHLAALMDLTAAVIFLFLLLLVRNNFSLFSVVWFLIIAAAFSAFSGLFIALKMVKADFTFDFGWLKYFIRESLPMGALMAIFSIYNRADVFILQALKGEVATGIYVLAYKVHDNLILGAAYLMNAFFPVIANSLIAPSEKIETKVVIQKAFDLLLAMAFPLVILVFVLSPMIINLLGGGEFLNSIRTLKVLVLATGVAYLNHLTGYSLAALGKQRVHLKFGILALFTNISLNVFLIPSYSFIGAAAVTVLTELLIFILTFSYLSKVLKVRLSFTSFPKTAWELIIKKGKVF